MIHINTDWRGRAKPGPWYGRYYEDCHEAAVIDRRDGYASAGVARYALDPANAERLWEDSLRMLG